MSVTFTKLFSGLTESTVWVEPYATRVLWVSMLSWADQYGRVFGSIPGIARRAGINMDECEAALVSFLSPDRHSRTPDNEGRRIEKIDGGWRLLNYAKYREIRHAEDRTEQNRLAKQRQREREKLLASCGNVSTNISTNADSQQNHPRSAQAEAEAEAEAEDQNLNPLSGKPDVAAPKDTPKPLKPDAEAILAFLNEKAGRAYRPTVSNIAFIVARLKEGYTAAQCRQVVAKKCREWLHDDKMALYLRPATLFNREKFNSYAGELVVREDSNG